MTNGVRTTYLYRITQCLAHELFCAGSFAGDAVGWVGGTLKYLEFFEFHRTFLTEVLFNRVTHNRMPQLYRMFSMLSICDVIIFIQLQIALLRCFLFCNSFKMRTPLLRTPHVRLLRRFKKVNPRINGRQFNKKQSSLIISDEYPGNGSFPSHSVQRTPAVIAKVSFNIGP